MPIAIWGRGDSRSLGAMAFRSFCSNTDGMYASIHSFIQSFIRLLATFGWKERSGEAAVWLAGVVVRVRVRWDLYGGLVG